MSLKEFYESKIDFGVFGVVADHLKKSEAPINYVIHVRERSQVVDLAVRLHGLAVGSPEMQNLLKERIRDNSILISSRKPIALPDGNKLIEAGAVPRDSTCLAIQQPPFCIAHTAGLFQNPVFAQEPLQLNQISFAEKMKEPSATIASTAQKASSTHQQEQPQTNSIRKTPKLSF